MSIDAQLIQELYFEILLKLVLSFFLSRTGFLALSVNFTFQPLNLLQGWLAFF
jgi:hypothetical protein